jgi:hypothetical protein
MPDFITIFFIGLSIIAIVYFIYNFWSSKRIPFIFKIFFIGIYSLIALLFFYPELLSIIENVLDINSAINFFIYLAIFSLFIIVFALYKEISNQRLEITKLNREIALKENKKKN